MASWQAHAIDMFARMHLKPRLAGERDLARARAILSEGSFPVPAGAVYRAATLDGVLGEWVAPAQCPTPVPVVLYLHGGGYFTGTPKAHRQGARARRSGGRDKRNSRASRRLVSVRPSVKARGLMDLVRRSFMSGLS
jgi:acetyl esterase/lipase